MLVSVIIPAYNASRYIGEAIASVFEQTYKEFEVIVIDDGSTDNTPSLISEFYPHITYYRVPHKGVSAARNFGIMHSRGDYIAFLDADDKWLPEKLERQCKCFEMDPSIGMVFTEEACFNEDGVTVTMCHKRKRLMQGDIVKNIFLRSFVGTSSVMVKKEVFSTVGLFSEKLTIGEDDNLWIRITYKFPVLLLDESFMLYRISPGSLTRKPGQFFRGVYKSVRILENDFPELAVRLGKKAIHLKYASIFFSEGYSYFSKQSFSNAHKYFLRSFFYNPLNGRCLLLLMITFFPSTWIAKLIKLNNGISSLRSRISVD